MHLPATHPTCHSTWDPLIQHLDYQNHPPGNAPNIPPARCTPQASLSSKQSVEDILQTILRTRKSWKTLKGQAEAVWPPYLEATMLKALQDYEPDDSRETRILGRYPMRNRFISDYIHRTTGKYRSAKQVGSRLQQLRDTAEGRELIDSLTRCYHTRTGPGSSNARVSICHPTPWAPSSSPQFSTISCDTASWDSSSTSSSSDSPATPSDYSPIMSPVSSSKQRQPTDSRMPVYIDILPEHPRWSSTAYGSSIPSHAPVASSSVGSSSHGPSFRPSDAARHMRDIDPTVTFVSPSPVNGKSSYIVLLDGAPVHSEDTKLEYVGPYYSSSSSSSAGQNSGNGPVLYTTALVPKYWDILCKAADPTLYTIIQDVYRAPDPVPNQGFSQRPRPVLIFSAIYHFQYLASLDSSTTASNIQSPPVGPAMTSALDDQVLHDYLNPMRPMPFQKYSVYPTPTPEKSWTTPTMEQNVFDEPFMLDVNFDDVRFDDFTVNIQDSPDGTPRASSGSFYPTDTNAFFM